MNRLISLNSFLWLLCSALLIDLVVLVFKFSESAEVQTWTPYLVLAGVLVALMTIIFAESRKDSEHILGSTKELHDFCYHELDPNSEGVPTNRRMNWLAAARFLRASEEMSTSILLASHRKVYLEHREYLRAKLYDLINPEKSLPEDFYAEDHKTFLAYTKRNRPPIAGSSLAVLYRFTRWPKDYEDPIADTKKFSDDEIENMIKFGPRPLGTLLRKVYPRRE